MDQRSTTKRSKLFHERGRGRLLAGGARVNSPQIYDCVNAKIMYESLDLATQVSLAGISNALAATVTNPIDVLKVSPPGLQTPFDPMRALTVVTCLW